MHGLPPLNGLRAFEAAARWLSLTKAAAELNVSPGAISHQIRGLEALLGVQLFERRVRAIVLTAAGKLLYPGVQTGFVHLREAVAGLKQSDTARVLVVSTRASLRNGWRHGFTASPMRIPRSTRAFRRRPTTPISRPTACTSRSATWRNIQSRIQRSTWKNSSRCRSCRCAVRVSSNVTGH
jgi:hypothetical protein